METWCTVWIIWIKIHVCVPEVMSPSHCTCSLLSPAQSPVVKSALHCSTQNQLMNLEANESSSILNSLLHVLIGCSSVPLSVSISLNYFMYCIHLTNEVCREESVWKHTEVSMSSCHWEKNRLITNLVTNVLTCGSVKLHVILSAKHLFQSTISVKTFWVSETNCSSFCSSCISSLNRRSDRSLRGSSHVKAAHVALTVKQQKHRYFSEMSE